MRVEITGTLVGYDADNGQKLFTQINRPVRLSDGTSSLPLAGDFFRTEEKQYQVVGVRRGSTESNCEIELREVSTKG